LGPRGHRLVAAGKFDAGEQIGRVVGIEVRGFPVGKLNVALPDLDHARPTIDKCWAAQASPGRPSGF
jgi:hypothetical protein